MSTSHILSVKRLTHLEVDIIYDLLSYDNWISAMFIVGCVAGVVFWHSMLRLYSKYVKEPKIRQMLGIPEEATAEEQNNQFEGTPSCVLHSHQGKIEERQVPALAVDEVGKTIPIDS